MKLQIGVNIIRIQRRIESTKWIQSTPTHRFGKCAALQVAVILQRFRRDGPDGRLRAKHPAEPTFLIAERNKLNGPLRALSALLYPPEALQTDQHAESSIQRSRTRHRVEVRTDKYGPS